jgi:hypothetical protein
MKRFSLFACSIVALLLVALSVPAQSVTYEPVTLIDNVVVGAQSATNLFNAGTINCKKQRTVGVQISTSNTVDQSTSGAINGVLFVRSVDGVNFETNGTYVTWVPVGKNWLTTHTNIDTYGAGYMKILFATNAAASGGGTTNVGSLHIAYAVKAGL